MSEAVKIRPVEPEDWARVADVIAQPNVVWGTMQTPHQTLHAHRERLSRPSPGTTYLCAVIDGRIVGLASLDTTPLWPRRAHAGSIGMSVHDAFQGRGVSAALLGALLHHADRWLNLRRVELRVFIDNARAIGLYERFGFEREGVLRDYGFRDGAFVDVISMARLRRDGSTSP